MSKSCLVCGKQFETHDKRKKYCSVGCAKHAKIKQNSVWNKDDRDKNRREWARYEAEWLYHVAITSGVDALTDCVYNRFEKRKRRKTK